jgi:hypothetical protein
MRRAAQHMTDQQLVAEIHQLRKEIGDRAFRITELSRTLYIQARRKGVRQDFERLNEVIAETETQLRTASAENAPGIQRRLAQLRQELGHQKDRIAAYTVFSNAYTRLAGMISQGLQRMRSSDRLVANLPAPEEEEEAPEPPKKVLRHEAEPATRSLVEDLIEMYGEGDTGHADRR